MGAIQFIAPAASNATSYNLYYLGSKMTFSKLASGTYTYSVRATETSGSQSVAHTLVSKTFKVAPPSISSAGLTVPTTLTKGNGFGVYGTVTANKVKTVSMAVYSVAGVKQFGVTITPGTASNNLHNQDAKMTFRSLPAGKFTYRVAVTNTDGITKYVISKAFTVQ